MKIQILKEKDWFFGKVVWEQWAYAVWDSIEDTLDNLMDVYYQVLDVKKDIIKKEFSRAKIWNRTNKPEILFKNLEFSI